MNGNSEIVGLPPQIDLIVRGEFQQKVCRKNGRAVGTSVLRRNGDITRGPWDGHVVDPQPYERLMEIAVGVLELDAECVVVHARNRDNESVCATDGYTVRWPWAVEHDKVRRIDQRRRLALIFVRTSVYGIQILPASHTEERRHR